MSVFDFVATITGIKQLKILAGGAGEELFARAGAEVYVGAANQIALNNLGRKEWPLDENRKEWLRPNFASLVDKVRIVYGAKLIPSISIFNVKLSTSTIAQTFGDKIYVRRSYMPETDSLNPNNDLKEAERINQLLHVAHELVHVRQYHDRGKSLYKFGKAYFRGLYQADFSYRKNPMEAEGFDFHQCFWQRLFSNLAVPEIFRSTFPKGLTSIMPFILNSQQHFLAYNSSTGAANIGRIHSDAQGIDTIWSTTSSDKWTKGWTAFVPFIMNAGVHYLAYKSGSGQVEIDRIRPNGKGVDTIWEGEENWTKGWTAFVPFSLEGKPHYLAYKRGNGEVAIDRIRPDGQGVDTIWPTDDAEKWTKGWSSFVPFFLKGVPHYLAYKEGTGTVHIDRFRSDGQGVENVWKGEFSEGWTSMIGFDFQKRPHILRYEIDSGYTRVDSINDNGLGATHAWCDRWTKGWSTFFPFRINTKPFHLAYKKNAGTVAIDLVEKV